ncbi:MAG: cytochrome c nitrite reductase small subunit [Cytophagales bacterium]|nr:cytochrome c nitrite reductase small subunit [Cytophagales bacterium]
MHRLYRLYRLLLPPGAWRPAVILVAGVFAGLGCYIVYTSKAHSYLSDEPTTCVNCHIMAPQFATWQHSSHHLVATCNDCHVPHDNVLNKYYFKAKDGLRHATIFTLRAEPQVIRMHAPGQRVVQQNCIRCHESLVEALATGAAPGHVPTDRQCWSCHREVPHGRVKSLSATPYAQVPLLQSHVPPFLEEYIRQSLSPPSTTSESQATPKK